MIYKEKLPSSKLRPYINCFWEIRASACDRLRDRTFPDGCQEIVFNIDTTVLRSDAGGCYNPSAELIGQMTRPYDLITEGKNWFFGVKFYPHGFSRFTAESIKSLCDQSIDLRDLLNSAFYNVLEAVFSKPDFNAFVKLMEQYLTQHLERSEPPPRSFHVVQQVVHAMLSSKGAVTIDKLLDELNISERYLQQQFQRHIGLSPKQLLKMIRFQSTFQYLRDSTTPLTDIAHCCGYYDQAHFNHDFKSLSGLSPSAYRQMPTPLNQFFLTKTSQAYLCNY